MSGDEKKPKPSTPALDATRVDTAAVDLEATDFATEEIPTQEARRLESDHDEPWTDEVTEPGEARPSVLPDLDDDPPTQQVEIDVTPKRYEMLDSLGVLGMGEVLRVRDRELDRVVGMTLLHPRFMMSPRSMARFREGVLLAAGLQHPGIPPVYDIGMLPDGRVYFTMPENNGPTLEASRLAPEVTPRRALRWLLRVVEAIAYAHGRGVVHGWLGPAVVRIGEPGRVTVHGWGFRPSTTARPYTAPELRGGQQTEPSATTDVFALGAMLWFVLVGAAPKPGVATAPSSEGGPPDAALDAICLAAMSPRPAERPADAGALLRNLVAWIEDGGSFSPRE